MKNKSKTAPGVMEVEDDATRLANRLARAIFRCGDSTCSPCTRLAFKGGKWPDAERDQGGLVEKSLATLIADALRNPTRGT